MSDWQPIETAPTGTYKIVKRGKQEVKIFVPEWCFVMFSGQRFWTYKNENGRWIGLTAEQTPDCWHPAPRPPEANND